MHVPVGQTSLMADGDTLDLKSPYLTDQLVTYIGNKRRLLPFLHNIFRSVEKELGKQRVRYLDGFAGSGAVSRLLTYHAATLHSNDFENYTKTINTAYLTNRKDIDMHGLAKWITYLNSHKLDTYPIDYFITDNYAPANDDRILPGERVFYTHENAKIIDNIRYLIGTQVPQRYRVFCLANLLVKASIHNNTSGVFKGFHKKNGVGHFGGAGEHALQRIKKQISLDLPVFSESDCEVTVTCQDINSIVRDVEVDIAYYDPPYNQHPYGSNYFMLNLINDGKMGEKPGGVSGIVKNWKRSAYNKRAAAEKALDRLLADTRADFVVISYNNEGIIPVSSFRRILEKHGTVRLMTQKYNTYRGSRNLRARNIHVEEHAWILKKRQTNQ